MLQQILGDCLHSCRWITGTCIDKSPPNPSAHQHDRPSQCTLVLHACTAHGTPRHHPSNRQCYHLTAVCSATSCRCALALCWPQWLQQPQAPLCCPPRPCPLCTCSPSLCSLAPTCGTPSLWVSGRGTDHLLGVTMWHLHRSPAGVAAWQPHRSPAGLAAC